MSCVPGSRFPRHSSESGSGRSSSSELGAVVVGGVVVVSGVVVSGVVVSVVVSGAVVSVVVVVVVVVVVGVVVAGVVVTGVVVVGVVGVVVTGSVVVGVAVVGVVVTDVVVTVVTGVVTAVLVVLDGGVVFVVLTGFCEEGGTIWMLAPKLIVNAGPLGLAEEVDLPVVVVGLAEVVGLFVAGGEPALGFVLEIGTCLFAALVVGAELAPDGTGTFFGVARELALPLVVRVVEFWPSWVVGLCSFWVSGTDEAATLPTLSSPRDPVAKTTMAKARSAAVATAWGRYRRTV